MTPFVAVSPALSIELGEWVPGLRATVGVTERLEYESNVFQAHSGAQDDFISRTSPFVILDWSARPLLVSAGYRLEILRFFELEGQDDEHHIAFAEIGFRGTRLNARVRDDLTRTSDPPSSELTGRIESLTNVLAPEVEFRLTPRFSVGSHYSWTRVDFATHDVEVLDRDEHAFGGSVFWKFRPRADVSLRYTFVDKTFDAARARDASEHLITVGLRGDITAKLSSTFRAGYTVRDPGSNQQETSSTYSFGGDWTYRPTERTTIVLATDRRFEESTFRDAEFFISTFGALSVDHRFTPKLSANARVSIGENDYPTKELTGDPGPPRFKFRNDTLLGWGAGLQYDIQRWLAVGAEYAHTRRDSNIDSLDYTDDKLTAKVTLQF